MFHKINAFYDLSWHWIKTFPIGGLYELHLIKCSTPQIPGGHAECWVAFDWGAICSSVGLCVPTNNFSRKWKTSGRVSAGSQTHTEQRTSRRNGSRFAFIGIIISRLIAGFLKISQRNMLNKNYFEQLLPAAGNAGHYAAVLGDQRTVGVTLRYAL